MFSALDRMLGRKGRKNCTGTISVRRQRDVCCINIEIGSMNAGVQQN
jgi:hypothetical protein